MKHGSGGGVTFTTISFFSSGFPSGNFSPKHMVMVYSGDLPLFSLNCFNSETNSGGVIYLRMKSIFTSVVSGA